MAKNIEKEINVNGQDYILKSEAQNAVRPERKGAWEIGKNYLIRTVTMIDIGTLVYIDDKEMILADASWIGDTGRFANALATGDLSEVEPFPGEAIIGRGAIVDAALWNHPLPRAVK